MKHKQQTKQAEKIAYLETIGWQFMDWSTGGQARLVMTDRECKVDKTGVVTERGTDYTGPARWGVKP